MSLNELLELKRKPWCNIEVEDLYVDGQIFPPGIILPIAPFMVGPAGFPYQTIQSAIDSAHATSPTDSNPAYIYVYPGTYTENLTLYGGILIFSLGDNTQNQLLMPKFGFPFVDFTSNNNAVQIVGTHLLQRIDVNDFGNVVFNNITFKCPINSNIFTTSPVQSANHYLTLNFCNVSLNTNCVAFSVTQRSFSNISLNSSFLSNDLETFPSTYSLITYENATNLTGASVIINLDNSVVNMDTASNMTIGDNFLTIYCNNSTYMATTIATVLNNCVMSFNAINSFVVGGDFYNFLTNPLCDGIWTVRFRLNGCYSFLNGGVNGGFNGPFVNNVTSVLGLTMDIVNCYYPDLIDIVTNSTGNILEYKISNLYSSAGILNNINNYIYQIGTSPFVYQTSYTTPSASRSLNYYDPGDDCSVKLGILGTVGPVNTDSTLLASDSGKLIRLDFSGANGDYVVALPPTFVGLNYKFASNDVGSQNAVVHIRTADSNIIGYILQGTNSVVNCPEVNTIVINGGGGNLPIGLFLSVTYAGGHWELTGNGTVTNLVSFANT